MILRKKSSDEGDRTFHGADCQGATLIVCQMDSISVTLTVKHTLTNTSTHTHNISSTHTHTNTRTHTQTHSHTDADIHTDTAVGGLHGNTTPERQINQKLG